MQANGKPNRLAATTEARYLSMATHVDRMSRYVEVIARRLGLDDLAARLLRGAAKLHDAGKIAIPDRILLKPGPLTPTERSVIELHTVIGHEFLRSTGSDLLDVAAVIALSHHERWDGTGYPHGRVREEIPISGRIAAVADVFDSLTRDRPYRPALTVDRALRVIEAERGKQFDPYVVDAFFAGLPEIRRARRAKEVVRHLDSIRVAGRATARRS
jgi:HD-GYP domain-containing protein (c-di-GMP phosphodiesterase class II)